MQKYLTLGLQKTINLLAEIAASVAEHNIDIIYKQEHIYYQIGLD